MIDRRFSPGQRGTYLVPLAGLLLGVAGGAAVAFAPPLIPFAALIGIAAALIVLRSSLTALVATFAVIALLPFGTLPVKIGLTPTLLELALAALAATWVLRMLARPDIADHDQGLRLSPIGGLVLAFLGFSLFSFLIGSNGSPDSLTLHNYVKLVLGVLLFFSVLNVVRTVETARAALRWLIGLGAAAAGLGLGLWALPDALALRLLVALGPLGYPVAGRVLRYVNDDPAGVERAIGTSVDPNGYGGMMALIAALTLSQALGSQPVMGRKKLWAAFGLMAGALLLTQSRAALGGLVLASLFLATLRYRRLWWGFMLLGIAALVVFGALGQGEAFVTRIEEGVRFEDQANVMRLNEYRNAIRIIQAYPVFGVGFGSAPTIDLTTGVSSVYLTIASRMGLVGLAIFLITMLAFFLSTAGARRNSEHPAAEWLLGIQAALVAAMAVGVLDHYFFNIEFSHMVALFWGVVGLGSALQWLLDHQQTEGYA